MGHGICYAHWSQQDGQQFLLDLLAVQGLGSISVLGPTQAVGSDMSHGFAPIAERGDIFINDFLGVGVTVWKVDTEGVLSALRYQSLPTLLHTIVFFGRR